MYAACIWRKIGRVSIALIDFIYKWVLLPYVVVHSQYKNARRSYGNSCCQKCLSFERQRCSTDWWDDNEKRPSQTLYRNRATHFLPLYRYFLWLKLQLRLNFKLYSKPPDRILYQYITPNTCYYVCILYTYMGYTRGTHSTLIYLFINSELFVTKTSLCRALG